MVKVQSEIQIMNDQRSNMASIQFHTPQISGNTDVYLILGDPVEQVLAPEIFNPIFARFGLDAILVPVQVAPAELNAFVKTAFLARNIKGMWVTMPHKKQVMEVLDRSSELATMAGAVNAIRRNTDGSLEGGLFDGEGFARALDYFNIDYADKRVLIVGAGGAAAAIAASLAQRRQPGVAAEVALFDPVAGKATEMAARIAAATGTFIHAVTNGDPAGFDVVVNASPLGLRAADPLPCDVSRLAPHAALVDIVMKNQPTPVVRAARARGLHAQPGFEMLIQQAHLYLDFFGFAEAAQQVRHDATFLREQIYPDVLKGEIVRPTPAHIPSVNVRFS